MFIFLVQHGKAKTEEEDPRRPLTGEGAGEVEKIGLYLKKLNLIIDSIRHSGKLRAVQTAEILARHINPQNGTGEIPGLNPTDNPVPIARFIHQQTRDLMLVGHLPFIDKLCSLLVSGRENIHTVRFRQGSVLCLEREGEQDSFSVKWFIIPEIL